MNTSHKIVVSCLAFALAPSVAVVTAALPHLASWKQVSDDGRYVLVMVSPLTVDEDAGHPSFDGVEIRNIRATYPESALYPNDGTTVPIWTTSYQDWTHQVFIGPQGKHLIVAANDWSKWANGDQVVCFYADGAELATYSITDLCLPVGQSLPSFSGVDCDGVSFDADTLTFAVRTNQGNTFWFDATNGKLVRHESLWLKYIAVAVVGLVLAVVLMILRGKWIRRL